MPLWVYNPFDRDFVLLWGGQEYLLESDDYALLPDEVVKAYFPKLEDLAGFLPAQPERAKLALRGFLEIYLSRWGSQIDPYYRLTGNLEEDIEKFFDFIEKFQIGNERPPKRRRQKEGNNE